MIYAVVGPTGVGKTKLSIALAKKLNAEIVNADSMQFYRGLDIGTAKIKEEEKEGIVHHLFDILDVTEYYTIYDYQKDARRVIEEITSRGKNVILVGGSGLYLRAALYDYSFPKEEQDRNFDSFSNEEIYDKLRAYTDDIPVHPNNRQRLVRLLSRYQNGEGALQKGSKPIYSFQMIGLTTDRETLYEKINRRVDQMMKDGLLEEVSSFYQKKIRSKAILTGIGYKELYSYLDGNATLEEAIDEIKKNSRRYAKRQYTFFKHQFPVTWFSTNYDDFSMTVQEVLQFLTMS